MSIPDTPVPFRLREVTPRDLVNTLPDWFTGYINGKPLPLMADCAHTWESKAGIGSSHELRQCTRCMGHELSRKRKAK